MLAGIRVSFQWLLMIYLVRIESAVYWLFFFFFVLFHFPFGKSRAFCFCVCFDRSQTPVVNPELYELILLKLMPLNVNLIRKL